MFKKVPEGPKVGELVARMGISDTGYILGEIVEITQEYNEAKTSYKNQYKVIWNEQSGPLEETHNEGYVRSAAWSMKLYREVNMMDE